MIVPVVGSGTGVDPRRPDLPEGTAYTVVEDHGDTMDVEVSQGERVDALEAQVAAVTALADKANATAQEVAQAMRDARPAKP